MGSCGQQKEPVLRTHEPPNTAGNCGGRKRDLNNWLTGQCVPGASLQTGSFFCTSVDSVDLLKGVLVCSHNP